MSILFYDRLVVVEELDELIKKHGQTAEEREELSHLVDEMIHHRVMGCILERLPEGQHQEFLAKFSEAPHSESLLDYLKDKVENIEEEIGKTVKKLVREIKKDLTG